MQYRPCVILAAAGFVLYLFVPMSVSAAPISKFKIGNWRGGAYTFNSTKKFSHCAISAHYKSGIQLIFAVGGSFRWSMGLASNRWQLTPGAKYPITYSVDGKSPIKAEAFAKGSKMVKIHLINSTALFAQFQKGYVLRINAVGKSFAFNLTGSAKALEAVLACAVRYTTTKVVTTNPFAPAEGRGKSTNPFAPVKKSTRVAKTAYYAEATAALANVLSASGISGFRVLQRSQIPKALQKYHAVWEAPGIVGTLSVMNNTKIKTANSATTILIAYDARSCSGAYISGRLPSANEGRVHRVATACSNGEDSWNNQYLVVSRMAGGFYVLSVSGIPKFKPIIEDSARKLQQVALTLQ